MDRNPSVFEETYQNYLAEIAKTDLSALEERLGMTIREGKRVLPFFGQPYEISGNGIISLSGRPPRFDIRVVLCKYILLCPDHAPSPGEWVAYRDIPGSGPLLTYYLNDVENPIARHFTGRLDDLEKRCRALGGDAPDMDLAYDLSMQMTPLPKIPMLLLYNDADEEFPAGCSVLFKQNAAKYLDLESLAILGAQFSNFLTKDSRPG